MTTLEHRPTGPDFDSAIEIFKTWQKLHTVLKQDYFLVPGHGDDDAIESSRMDVLRGVAAAGPLRSLRRYRSAMPPAPPASTRPTGRRFSPPVTRMSRSSPGRRSSRYRRSRCCDCLAQPHATGRRCK